MIVIGSRALAYWFPAYREPKDFDCVASLAEATSWINDMGSMVKTVLPSPSGDKLEVRLHDGLNIEIELIEQIPSDALLAELLHTGKLDFHGATFFVPSLTVLFLIKKSHIFQPIHWQKNIADYHFLRHHAYEPSESEARFFQTRRAEVNARAKKKPPSLMMTNSDFFRQHKLPVQTQFPHDALHWAVAYYDEPVFNKMKHDPSLAKCDRDLFEALPLEMRLRCVREETMVIALERYLLPGIETDQDVAYAKALERVCTTLTSGWFRTFAVENYPMVKQRDIDFVSKFWSNIDAALPKAA